jgi:hypothetical protein
MIAREFNSTKGLNLGAVCCSKTIAIDGVKGGVNYDDNDRYCLDGQRLIAISCKVYSPFVLSLL